MSVSFFVYLPVFLTAWLHTLNLLPSFQKEGAWQDLNFEMGSNFFQGVRGGNLFQGVQFLQKNELKSEIFNDKRSL